MIWRILIKGLMDRITDKLDLHGLNLSRVFKKIDLNDELITELQDCSESGLDFDHVLLVGNFGRAMWENLQNQPGETLDDDNPIDRYSTSTVETILDESDNVDKYEIIYPGPKNPPLQRLGKLAGFQSDSLLKIGIHPEYGTWFAYRVLALLDCDFISVKRQHIVPVCMECKTRDCIRACPVNAVTLDKFESKKCFDYRIGRDSPCQKKCLARIACPVGKEHQYSAEQISWHYSRSYQSLINSSGKYH